MSKLLDIFFPGRCPFCRKLSQNGAVTDAVESYFGMRDVDLDGKAIRINGKAVFQ